MKILMVMTLSMFAFGAMAAENLNDMKRMANDSISREISTLQSNKTCINNAKSVDALKACKYDMSESMDVQKEEEKKIEKKVKGIEDDSMQKKEEVLNKEENLETEETTY